jgi:uncharacterized protein YjbI with pentapeptide repeats
MSDEQRQQPEQQVQVAQAEQSGATGDKWGDPISEERQNELRGYLDRWENEQDRGERKGPFDGASLTGADVVWLAEQVRHDYGWVESLHLEGADLREAHLEGVYLIGTHLERADLREAHLEQATLNQAHLEGAYLIEAHLEKATLSEAHLEGADLRGAHLEGAYLIGTHLERAVLFEAHLEGADLRGAHLEGAYLIGTHLEGRTYAPDDPDYLRIRAWHRDFPATQPPADLRGAVLDAATSLNDITLGDGRRGGVPVADVRWGGANLAVVDWTPLIEPVTELGDERTAREWKPDAFSPSKGTLARKELAAEQRQHTQVQKSGRLQVYRAAVRANRQLATALRDQGMNEEADQFAYRAQVLQRQVFWQQSKRGRAAFSWVLDRVAGHGYKPLRSLYTYLGVLFGFAALYFLVGNGLLAFGLPVSQFHDLPWYEAVILSVSSFHGRGFFQPVQSLGDPVAILAALEAIFGLFIEVSFIATFTQRFFGK